MTEPLQAWSVVLEDIDHCNKCGFCLPACPTYQLTGSELDSPRGRIAMVEAAARQEIEVGPGLEESLTYCLACRACETACPSGVPYHRILEAGLSQLRRLRPHRLRWASRGMLTLVRHARWLGSLSAMGSHAKQWPMPEALAPLVPLMGYQSQSVPVLPQPEHPRAHVSFFRGCVMSAVFPDANHSAENLLKRAKVAVDTPGGQKCCGALHLHAGEHETALAMAKQNILAFEAGGDDLIVNTAGGCGAMLMEYGELLKGDPVWAERARNFSSRVRDWSTVFRPLADFVPLEGGSERVLLQNSCHLVNVEHAGQDASNLAGSVEGDQFVPYSGQDRCCGSAGIYNIEHPAWSAAILDSKMSAVASLKPDRILVNNPGCHLQMRWGAERAGLAAASVEHLATYLEQAARRAEDHHAHTAEGGPAGGQTQNS